MYQIQTKTKESKRMPNYRSAKLYYIRSHLRPDLVYIGATCCELSVRFGQHKSTRNNTRSKQIIELGDAYIELIELYPCDSKEELSRREGELIRSMDCVNKQIPGRTQAEWREEKKEELKVNKKQYYQDHKNEIAVKSKKWREEHMEDIKKYYQDHKNEIAVWFKQYYQNHNQKIKEQRKQRYHSNKNTISCICGGRVDTNSKSDRNRHLRSNKHTEFVSCFPFN